MTRTPSSAGTSRPAAFLPLLNAVAEKARSSGVFGSVRVDGDMLRCDALASAEPAEYRLFWESGKLWVALVTEHRWLSQSIEQDLVHTGDKIEDLLEEELVDLGWEKTRLTYEHFRDPNKLYTFRSPVPVDLAKLDAQDVISKVAIALLAYEQAFRPLGDMEADEDEE